MEKKIKCNVCDFKFRINKKDIYTISIPEGGLIKTNIDYYNAIDCPNCGCQKLLYKRYKKVNVKED